jgi:hypothetical protein
MPRDAVKMPEPLLRGRQPRQLEHDARRAKPVPRLVGLLLPAKGLLRPGIPSLKPVLTEAGLEDDEGRLTPVGGLGWDDEAATGVGDGFVGSEQLGLAVRGQ